MTRTARFWFQSPHPSSSCQDTIDPDFARITAEEISGTFQPLESPKALRFEHSERGVFISMAAAQCRTRRCCGKADKQRCCC